VRVRSALVFTAGYVLGTKAGRRRYAQIVELAYRAGARLERYSRPEPDGPESRSSR